MLRWFSNRGFGGSLALVLFAAASRLIYLLQPIHSNYAPGGFVAKWWPEVLSPGFHPVIGWGISLLTVIFVARVFGSTYRMVRSQELTGFIPEVFFLLFLSLWPGLETSLLSCAGLLLLVLLQRKLFQFSLDGPVDKVLFDAGLVCSMAIWVNSSWFPLVLAAPVAALVVRKAKPREIAVLLCGMLVPFVLIAAFAYLTDTFGPVYAVFHNSFVPGAWGTLVWADWIGVGFAVLVFGFSLLQVQFTMGTRSFQERDYYMVVLIMAVAGMAWLALDRSLVAASTIWLAVPVASFFCGAYAEISRQKMRNRLWIVMILVILGTTLGRQFLV